MIYFITNNSYYYDYYKDNEFITCLEDDDNTFKLFKDFISTIKNNIVGYDVETNGLDAYVNDTILRIIGDEENQFVLHSPFCSTRKYMQSIYDLKSKLLGHNIKFDLKMTAVEDSVLFSDVYDTMLAEQRLYMKSGLSSSLGELLVRYLKEYPKESDKLIRNEFIGANPSKFKVLEKHILYAVGDIKYLFLIKEEQEIKIAKYSMEYLIYEIEFPLIRIIALAELTGFKFDKEKWLEVYEENKIALFEIELKLDKEVRRLRDLKYGNSNTKGITYIPEKRIYLSGGKWDNERIKNSEYDLFNTDGTVNSLNLFGEPMKVNTYIGSKAKKAIKIKENPNNINYGSDPQIIEIFAKLEEPLFNKREILIIPTLNKKGKADKSEHSFQTNENAFNTYLSTLPGSEMKVFIELLLEHRSLIKAISTYGANFINKLNPITGKLHTNFKQCFTDTGRMASGGGLREPDKPNFQNIPSKASYAVKMRNCFIANEGFSIGTDDLSGAELIIMCSLSQDLKLLEIARQDIHSYVAQGCWRLIYKYRAIQKFRNFEKYRNIYTKEQEKEKLVELATLKKLSLTYIVDKTKKVIRTAFKPMTFGTIYGMYAGKAAKTLNIAKEEGQIVIDFIKKEFPDVFAMVERASAFARTRGYLILNSRTNSRMWFPNIIKLLKGLINEKESFRIISKELSEARNGKIQGTQADMIKEMTVEIQKWIDDNGFSKEIIILSWVHDEIIDEHPDYLNGHSKEAKQWFLNEGNFLTYNGNNYCCFPHVKRQIMRDTANKYLNNVEMDVDGESMKFWTK